MLEMLEMLEMGRFFPRLNEEDCRKYPVEGLAFFCFVFLRSFVICWLFSFSRDELVRALIVKETIPGIPGEILKILEIRECRCFVVAFFLPQKNVGVVFVFSTLKEKQ